MPLPWGVGGVRGAESARRHVLKWLRRGAGARRRGCREVAAGRGVVGEYVKTCKSHFGVFKNITKLQYFVEKKVHGSAEASKRRPFGRFFNVL
jgi:hypothetical protein